MRCYINGIEIENFRSFAENVSLDFRALTILTGPNNSGKSSISKALLLLKENMKRDNIGTLNLGYLKGLSIKNIFNIDKKSKNFMIALSTKDVGASSEFVYPRFKDATGNYILFKFDNGFFFDPIADKDEKSYIITYGPQMKTSYESIFEMDWTEFKIIEKESKQKHIFKHIGIETACQLDSLNVEVNKEKVEALLNQLDLFLSNEQKEELYQAVRKTFTTINNLFYHSPLSDYFAEKPMNLNDFPELYKSAVINHTPDSVNFFTDGETGEEHAYIKKPSSFSNTIEELLYQTFQIKIEADEGTFPNSAHYLPQLIDKDKLFASLPSFQGLKTAIDKLFFINTVKVQQAPLYLQEYNQETFAGLITHLAYNPYLLDELSPFINHWIQEFEIGDALYIEAITGGSTIFIKRGKHTFNTNDIGFGSLQLISLILNIALHPEKIILLEEPEINLHPKIQSKLADLIIDSSIKFNIQFIIETHSEYIIRKMQYWVAKKELKNEDVIIHYLFDTQNKSHNEEQVNTITLNEDGSLEGGFGPGFFDEATNIQFELLRLNQQQFN